MNFELLNKMGLSNIDYSYLFIGLAAILFLLLIILIVQMIQFNRLKKKYNTFMGGKEAKTLEEKLDKIIEENQYIRDLSEENKKDIKRIVKEKELCFNRVGIKKYDAFKQMGGNLSFSVCLLNERKDGYIINSVHSSEGCYTYIKEIKSGLCELELSNEEKEALTEAIK